ncbi:MAG: YdcF family protein [Betaproteobacteria bacterium]|jgi:uncharacterized SAM-binding protein YcdF (DUF218 family)|nr:YdcF family protein [Betaproteobacteria bacterium]
MPSWQLTNAVAALLIPPGSLLLLLGLGLWLGRRHGGRLLAAAAAICLFLLSTPWAGETLLRAWEAPPAARAAPDQGSGAQAIVVLGGGISGNAPEYGHDIPHAMTLVRLRYAAHLHRRSGLPLLVSGGNPAREASAEADVMRRTLEQDFGIPVRWSENRSLNTLGNARLSRELLSGEGIDRILLVTHAWHLPRARLAFERAGFTVIPAPTGHTPRRSLRLTDVLPDAGALLDSALVCHEAIGMVWYRVRLLLKA